MATHPHYAPTEEFIARHALRIDEAETWVQLLDGTDRNNVTKHLLYNKETGQIVLGKKDALWHLAPEETVFNGFVATEHELEQIIRYTRW